MSPVICILFRCFSIKFHKCLHKYLTYLLLDLCLGRIRFLHHKWDLLYSSECFYLVCRNTMNFDKWVSYPAILPSSLISSNSLLIDDLGVISL